MLNRSRLRGILHKTTQLLESVTRPIHRLTMPQLYNKKPKWTKHLSLSESSNKTCRISLLTNTQKGDRPRRWQDKMPEPTLEGTNSEEAEGKI